MKIVELRRRHDKDLVREWKKCSTLTDFSIAGTIECGQRIVRKRKKISKEANGLFSRFLRRCMANRDF